MSAALAGNWWAVLLRGLLALAAGVLVFLMPGVALVSLVFVFALYMLADGVLAVISGARAASHRQRWVWLIVEGLLNFAAAAIALAWPGITILAFVALAVVWAVVSGAALLAAAFALQHAHGRWWMGLAGVLSIAWGVLLALAPAAGALVLTLWIGAYFLVFGVAQVVLGLRLRSRRTAGGEFGRGARA
jgi:uncharacterized membrane protein HdeD (DUF308 family)